MLVCIGDSRQIEVGKQETLSARESVQGQSKNRSAFKQGQHEGLGHKGDLQPSLDFNPRSGYKTFIVSSILLLAPSLLLHHFFLSIDIVTASRTTRPLYNNLRTTNTR
jgi:hypothetical protein